LFILGEGVGCPKQVQDQTAARDSKDIGNVIHFHRVLLLCRYKRENLWKRDSGKKRSGTNFLVQTAHDDVDLLDVVTSVLQL
jgi:hypothetical protein